MKREQRTLFHTVQNIEGSDWKLSGGLCRGRLDGLSRRCRLLALCLVPCLGLLAAQVSLAATNSAESNAPAPVLQAASNAVAGTPQQGQNPPVKPLNSNTASRPGNSAAIDQMITALVIVFAATLVVAMAVHARERKRG
jgi:hypothetical protein